MKTKKIILFMLLMTVSMVSNAAVEYYGITIDGSPITSDYQPNPSDTKWYYDPSANILHLKKWPGKILVDGDVNPDLNISVEGLISHKYVGYYASMIEFKGNGNHVVYGSGSISLSIQDNDQSIQTWGKMGIIQLGGNSHVTFKGIDITLESIVNNQPILISGFILYNNSYLTFDHCEVSINSNGEAIYNNYKGQIELRNCSLVEGTNNGQHIVDANGNDLTSITIHSKVKVDNFSFEVDPPVVGQPLSNSVVSTGVGNTILSAYWYILNSNGLYSLPNGYVCKLGEVYRVTITSMLSDEYYYSLDEPITVTVNSKPAESSRTTDNVTLRTSYTFKHYNLMVDGVQVTWDNKDDVLGTSFDPTTNTLTLNNFYLDTQEEYEWGINNNNDLSTFDYDIDVKNLTIKLKGNNTIRTESACLYFKDVNLTIEGPGKLNLTSWGMDAINVKNSTLTLDHAKVYAKGKVSALNGTGSAMTVNNSLLEASSANETQATILDFTAFQMTDSYFEDVYDDHDQVFYNSEYLYYDTGRCCLYYYGEYGKDGGFDQSYYDNPYVGKVIISPAKSSISTNINEAYGQRDSVKGQRNERYNLSGQRVGKDYKGIVIQNGKKTVVR